jgi:Calcineurin-like phosphoesterase
VVLARSEIVIGDVHARAGALESLLCAAGVLDRRGRRCRGWSVVQLGDLLDRHAASEANLDTARLAGEAVDIVLAGNHESRLLADAASPHGHALATLAAHGWPHAAAAFGDWLVTHAGVHPEFARDLPPRARECAEEINHRWHSRTCGRGDPLFHAVGPSRGGPAAFGGILWLHADECPLNAATPWGQITGHVPQREPTLRPRSWWAIDLGGRRGRLAALVRIGGEQRWRPIVVRERGAVRRLRHARAVAA